MAGYKSTARDLGAFICLEDEAGQGLRPPKGRTWAPRGARPVLMVRGAGGGRVSIAVVACLRHGDRPHLFFKLRVHRRRKGEPKGFTWAGYRDLITSACHDLLAPLVWVWDNLNIHLVPELASFAAENKDWLRLYRLPAYAPDLNPVGPHGACRIGTTGRSADYADSRMHIIWFCAGDRLTGGSASGRCYLAVRAWSGV